MKRNDNSQQNKPKTNQEQVPVKIITNEEDYIPENLLNIQRLNKITIRATCTFSILKTLLQDKRIKTVTLEGKKNTKTTK